MSKYSNYALGPDLSHYNQNVGIQTLVDHGCSFLIHKIGDGLQMVPGGPFDPVTYKDPDADERIQQAYNCTPRIPVILYHYMRFFGQTADQERQIEYLIYNLTTGKVPGKSYQAVMIDIEERGDSSTNIQKKTEALYAALLDALPGVKVGFYSSINYLNTVSPALRDWLSRKGDDKILWLAQWPWSKVNIGWDKLPQFIPGDTVKVLTPGFASWRFWQFAGDVSGFEGCSGSIDLNVYNGTTAQLYDWLGFTPTTPPVDPPADPGEPEEPPTNTTQLDRIEAALAGLSASVEQIKVVTDAIRAL